jgi:DNA-directed RNA polymerase subunit RPC12/RpoP
MRCVACGNEVISPPGRKSEELEEARRLVVDMGLKCRKCDGPVQIVEVRDAIR